MEKEAFVLSMSGRDRHEEGSRKATHLLWSIDDTGVEAELEHPQNSRKDGKDQHAGQSLRTVVSTGTEERPAHRESQVAVQRVQKCKGTEGLEVTACSDGVSWKDTGVRDSHVLVYTCSR